MRLPILLLLILASSAMAAQRPFPDSADRILIFTDQLPTQLSPPQLKFVASHYVGTQKMPPSWTATALLKLASHGKILLCQTSIAADNMEHRSFVVGSFLLVKGHHSYLNMMARSSLEWYPEYDIPLGKFMDEPADDVAKYYVQPWKCYRRLYEHGMVLVNPTGENVSVTLDKPYRLAVPHGGGAISDRADAADTLTYESITQVKLDAHCGCVLLSP